MTDRNQSQFVQHMQQIESLVRQLEGCADPAIRAAAQTLASSLLELHARAFEKMVGQLRQSKAGCELLTSFAADDLLGSVLLLHDLHPWTLEQRVEQVMKKLGPAVRELGGEVALVSVSPAEVDIRVTVGSGQGCHGAGDQLRQLVENALRDRAPEVESIRVEVQRGSGQTSALVQLTVEDALSGHAERSRT